MKCYICQREPRDKERFSDVGDINANSDDDVFCCDDCIDQHMDAMEGTAEERAAAIEVDERQIVEWPGSPEQIQYCLIMFGGVTFKPPSPQAGKIVRQQYESWLAGVKADQRSPS